MTLKMVERDKCIVCGSRANEKLWNSLGIYECSECGLAWRKHFDLEENYYKELNHERTILEEEKKTSRERNSWSRFLAIRSYLPQSGICDVGCGEGFFLEVLKGEGYEDIWGIEPSLFSYNLAKKYGHEVHNSDISALKPMGKEVNAFTLFHVIEHLGDPKVDLEILKNKLTPNGVLVIETPDINASMQKVTDHRNPLIYHEHLYYWSRKSMKMFLEQNGFKVLSMKRRSFDWENAPIRSSLTRLGLKPKSTQAISGVNRTTRGGSGSSKNDKPNMMREWIRKLLAYTVHILRKDDYLLVVARRVR